MSHSIDYSGVIAWLRALPLHNELLWLLMAAINFGTILLLYRLYGKKGLFAWIPVSVILANIQVIKLIELGGAVTTLGNIVYSTGFLVTDILSENHSRRESSQAVGIGFITLLFMTALSQLTLIFPPFAGDTAQPLLEGIFGFLPRIALGSLVAYGISQAHDVWAYHFWKNRDPRAASIWKRNNFSTLVSQLIDTAIFCSIAFAGTVPRAEFWSIMATTYILKVIVAALDTPLVYIARQWREKNLIPAD